MRLQPTESRWRQALSVVRNLRQPFTMSAAVVAVWHEFPREFGLAGYEDEYPDSNKVESLMYGKKGMVAAKLVAKVGQKLFRCLLPREDML